MAVFRLDRYLTECQVGSRSEGKSWIRKGAVSVNNEVVKRPEYKVNTELDRVCLYGEEIVYQQFYYFMLHKPAGVVSATEDARDRTVLELIKEPIRSELFPVGRLDKDTEGLLVLTNDGDLAHRLLSPKKHVDKCYYVRVTGKLTTSVVSRFHDGIDIGEKSNTLPAELVVLSTQEDASEAKVTICEGKFHQIKRMFEKTGHTVTYLKRLSMGGLLLDETLAPGEYRELSEEEIVKLQQKQVQG